MTKLYIVRHCETMGNLMHIFQGHIDLEITELGAKQLEALKERFDEIHIDRVFSSPLLRAKKTGYAIIGNKNIPLELDNGLIEINGGIIEGKTFDTIYKEFPDFREMWTSHPENFAPENGEKMTDAYDRIWNTVLKIAKENKDKTVACATHGGVVRCLLCKLINNDINKLSSIDFVGNTAVSLIEFDDEWNYTLKFGNDFSHLGAELINEDSKIPNK